MSNYLSSSELAISFKSLRRVFWRSLSEHSDSFISFQDFGSKFSVSLPLLSSLSLSFCLSLFSLSRLSLSRDLSLSLLSRIRSLSLLRSRSSSLLWLLGPLRNLPSRLSLWALFCIIIWSMRFSGGPIVLRLPAGSKRNKIKERI